MHHRIRCDTEIHVRTQIGNLLQKTNITRQTELLLLMRGMRF